MTAVTEWIPTVSRLLDVVFTDLIMPDKDGLEVIREIRQINREAKIIGMSGGSVKFADTYLKLAHGFGASRLLPKPFLMSVVLAIPWMNCLAEGLAEDRLGRIKINGARSLASGLTSENLLLVILNEESPHHFHSGFFTARRIDKAVPTIQ